MNREKAIEILIAVSVCDRPILSCDFCARYVGMGTDCTYPSDKEVEEAVLLLNGASNDAEISDLRKQEAATDRHQMTNADRIRSMSDKELVRLRYRGAPHCKSDDPMKCNRHDFADGMSPCELCYYEWLQKPAGEEDKHEAV